MTKSLRRLILASIHQLKKLGEANLRTFDVGLCFRFVNVFFLPPYFSNVRHYNELNTQPTNYIAFAVTTTSSTSEKSPRTRTLSFFGSNFSQFWIFIYLFSLSLWNGTTDIRYMYSPGPSVLQVTGNNQALSYVIKALFAFKVSKLVPT